MSATRERCRQRKAQCDDCGYTARVAFSWLKVGAPLCGNPDCSSYAQPMLPSDPADQLELGLIELDDIHGPARTELCRANGWDAAILRGKGQQTKAMRDGHGILTEPVRPICDHCAAPGCGSFVKRGQTHCRDHGGSEPIPF